MQRISEVDLDNIIWTDEVIIELGKRPRQWVTRRPDEQYDPSCIQHTFRSGRVSVMFWAGITSHSKTDLILLTYPPPKLNPRTGRTGRGGLTAEAYADQVLKGPLHDFWLQEKQARGEDVYVVEDGAPVHKGPCTKIRSSFGMKRLMHPGNSPDLNPIEAIWQLLKYRLGQDRHAHSSRSQLIDAAKRVWNSITIEEIQNHTGRMRQRIETVKANNGDSTRY